MSLEMIIMAALRSKCRHYILSLHYAFIIYIDNFNHADGPHNKQSCTAAAVPMV